MQQNSSVKDALLSDILINIIYADNSRSVACNIKLLQLESYASLHPNTSS